MAYVSIFLYIALSALAMQNVYKFLYKQKKYKVFPVSLFYSLAIPCAALRLFANVFAV